MKMLTLTLAVFVLSSGAAFADYNLSCKPDGRSPYLLEVRSSEFWAKTVTIELIKKSSKEVVATYAAKFDDKMNQYVFGADGQYSFFYDEDNSVGMGEDGPLDITVIWGQVKMKEVTDSIHCYEQND